MISSRPARSFWRCLLPAAALAITAFDVRPAVAQTARGIDIIERALAAKPDRRRGASLYGDLCISCHGARAHGNPEKVTPALAGQLSIYLIKQLTDFAEGQRNEPQMHRIASLKHLSTPQAVADVSYYLSSLPRDATPEKGDGRDLEAGRKYYDGLCAFCHGTRGEGNESHATPSLQHQHYSYLLMQTRSLAAGHRYSVPFEVMDVIEALPFDELTAIANYASRLPQAAAGPERN